MRKDQELEERFTKAMFAIIDVEHTGSFDEAIVAIVHGPYLRALNEMDQRKALPVEYDLHLSEHHALVPIAVDATAWNTDSLVAVPESFLYPSAALDEIGELLGLEESERGSGGHFDPARVVEAVRALVAPRQEPPTLRAIDGGQKRAPADPSEIVKGVHPAWSWDCVREDGLRPKARAKQHGPFCPAHHLFGQVDYDPCECDYAARSGLERPSLDASYHAGFRPWPTAALHLDQFLGGGDMIGIMESADRWNGLSWGCAR